MDEHKMIARANGKSTMEACCSLGEMINRLFDRLINNYPNKRVVWLMRYGKNRRIRKKNFTRIVDYYTRKALKK